MTESVPNPGFGTAFWYSRPVSLYPALVALAQRAAARDPDAERELEASFTRLRPGVEALCRRIVGDPARAEELTQDTLTTAWQKLDAYQGESTFSGWLAGIARNLCMNAVRKRTELLTEDGVIDADDPDAGALVALQAAEREGLLYAAAHTLTAVEQEAIHLRYVEGLPVEVITRMLEIPGESGARGVLQRCRRKLEAALRRELGLRGLGSSFLRDPA